MFPGPASLFGRETTHARPRKWSVDRCGTAFARAWDAKWSATDITPRASEMPAIAPRAPRPARAGCGGATPRFPPRYPFRCADGALPCRRAC